MARFSIPYGKETMPLEVPEENLKAVLIPKRREQGKGNAEEQIRWALEHPVGTPPLCQLARGKQRVVIVTSDHTRALPSKLTLPLLLEQIRLGNPDADITILIATGLHRPTTEREQREMFGDDIVDREKIRVNRAFCQEEFGFVGVLPSGAELWVNRLALESDLLITEGFIEPHFFAGFSGGRKSILPGICNEATINENHSFRAIASPYAATGVLEKNPIHEDMLWAARAVNVQFILNVAQDTDKRVIGAFAGDLELAHAQGVAFVRSLAQCRRVEADIVVTSNGGYPLDQNLYQSPKAVATAAACCAEGGVIIMCCSCMDGMGGENFERLITMGTVEEIEAYLSRIPARKTIPEQWCAQIYARILRRYQVILVTTFLPEEQVRRANMLPAASREEAMAMAYAIKGGDASVVVIPDGVSVLVTE